MDRCEKWYTTIYLIFSFPFHFRFLCAYYVGANLLDKLIKDIAVESKNFDVESFIPLLQKQIKKTKPYIRQLLVGEYM